jgi:predicted DNA-binding transcriptional regulator YafY
VESLTEHIEILSRYSPDSDSPQQYLSLLQQAIVHRKIVQVHYRSNMKEEVTRRGVEPIGLLHYGSAWHLIGWCHLRNDYRDFRLSRMLGIILQDQTFDPSAHPSIQEYIAQIRKSADLEEAIVHFDKTIIKYLQEQKYMNGFVSEEELDTCFRMKFLTTNLSYFGRWLLIYTSGVRVESPIALKNIMRELSENLSAHYQSC